ncbi:MAG: hypothetical protein IT579_00550 [Verrucomicrobia subdivision 3 bacterium]|nr:hypothetical protein [Limisphaerales bacterium]
MKLNHTLMAAALAAAVGFGATQVFAQNDGGDRPQRNRPPGDQAGGDRGPRNFDPAEMQKRMMERYKEQLEITDDTEWKAIEPMIQKVAETRLQTMGGMGRGMFGGRGNRGGGDNAGGGPRGGGFGQANPAADALQKAIEAKASNAEMKAALAKYIESRKAKQAALEKAQADLRKVLTPRQEAIAALNGLL